MNEYLMPAHVICERLDVGKNVLRRLADKHQISRYRSPKDGRQVLYNILEVKAILQPSPLD